MRNTRSLLSAFFLLFGSASAFLPLRPMWGSTSSPHPDSSSFSLHLRAALTQLQMSKEDPPKIIISGAPASGKGTQCEIIKEKFGVVHLSTGDMLRAAVAAGTEVGKLAKDFMDNGKLVPDNVIIGIVSRNQCELSEWAESSFSFCCFFLLDIGQRPLGGTRLHRKGLVVRWIPPDCRTSGSLGRSRCQGRLLPLLECPR